MSSAEGTTVIGKSMRVVGDLSGEEDLVVDGALDGTVRLAAARFTLGATGSLRGNVEAKDVIVLGKVEGDIRATGRVELRSSCSVLGNIYATSFSMEENAAFRGQIDPSRAQEPLSGNSSSGQRPVAVPEPARSTPLPAMLAAVAARNAAEPAPETPSHANLFAETEA